MESSSVPEDTIARMEILFNRVWMVSSPKKEFLLAPTVDLDWHALTKPSSTLSKSIAVR